MLGARGGSGVTARCPVDDCHRPIRSWRLWRRQPAQRAADVDIFFPILSRFAAYVPSEVWDPVDLAIFAAWGQWARTLLHGWAHGDRDARSTLVTEVALDAWCRKANLAWEALAEVEPEWCRRYAKVVRGSGLALPLAASEITEFDIAV
jgi:hypothetical protein